MNARQKAKSDMCQVVAQVCDENSAFIGEIAAFQNAVNKFKTLFAQLLETEQIRSMPLTGITADKGADRVNLCKLAANIAGYIYAYASVSRNETLKAEINYSHSKLLLMREDQLVATCQNIHALGTTNNGELKGYGVTDAKLSELQEAIDAFKASMPKPRVAKGQKTTLTAARNELFEQIDDVLLNQMDVLIPNYEEAHPEFVHRYREARKIKDPASTKTQLRGIVTNKADGLPIKDATVTVVGLGLTTQTNSAGEYQFKPIEQGEFTIRASASGFQDFEIDEFRIKLGEIKRFNIELNIA
jgi:hypothetical protein